ncbi:MAG: UbiA-like polyprenyltransferase [Trueperaceae bacterium]
MNRLRLWLDFVKFEHTLFALPFAYAGMVLAASGWPGWETFLWISVAMVGARTAAMAANRVIDAEIDARNPRTADRAIPLGRLSRRDGVIATVLGLALLVLAGWNLNPLTAALLPVATAFLIGYPYTKRFTWACHLWLGVTIGAAAAGGAIAVTGRFDLGAILLWTAVAAWIAGFDVIYAFLDRDFDLQHAVHSIPARFGERRAIDVVAGLHAVAIASLAAVAWATPLGGLYLAGVALMIAPVLVAQQLLVRTRGAAAALRAFHANLWVSGGVLTLIVADLAWTGAA